MGPYRSVILVLVAAWLAVSPSTCTHPRVWYVGGDDGWVLHPKESYEQWAGRGRFVVNDKLVFKYEKGKDSVLEVSKEAFEACNVSKPARRMASGESVVVLERAGAVYFVSGWKGHCEEGQKLAVWVLSKKGGPSAQPPSFAPHPLMPPPAISSPPPPPPPLPAPAGTPTSAAAASVHPAALVLGLAALFAGGVLFFV